MNLLLLAEETRISFLELLSRGGWFMVPILAASLLGLALIIERFIVLRRSQVIPPTFLPGLRNVYRGPQNTAEAVKYCVDHPSPVARVMAAGLRKLPLGEPEAERAIADAGANEVAKLRKVRTLHGIAAVSPTLGLLGTVYGMIDAFETASRIGLGHSEALTRGIYEALVTTMAGLIVAIPVLMFYYYFAGRVDQIVIDLNDLFQQFLDAPSAIDIPHSNLQQDPTPATSSLD